LKPSTCRLRPPAVHGMGATIALAFQGECCTFNESKEAVMGKKILVVDDDPDVRLFSVTVIEENGYTAIEAGDGEQGLQLIEKEHPDLVLLDVLMPRESGVRLYRHIKTDNRLKDLPVIILSGIARRSFLRSQKALDEFGDAPVPEPQIYLEKPVEPEELAEAIRSVLA
jgi:two-component system, OmpR family, phosphate regulon response regulator PhoB